ncbi:Gldg family protein [Endozoicomonas gorgoniicola]|uniref:Gldg family protein n=1 Tax=Endozoicomonas gorgoniicola TaxID=1234144 RepID=A0ABT3MY23_9GAMM|nr:Gldg family protein [Endozoicomonas gorgoniicola]MCW7554270.1 Gldg family protein [Endozoicomonas gorgoniicola]
MSPTLTKRLFSKAGLLVLALVTLLLTIGVSQLFKGARVDLTQDRLYTLSDGTKNLLDKLDGKATLQFFYSEGQTRELPFLRNYARRVTELLEEYVLASNGKLRLEVIDPEPFSENEDKAAEYGLQAVPLGGPGKEAYMGLVITNDEDDSKREVIGFLHPDKERFLEYDISKLVYSVVQKSRPKIGLVSTLQVNGGYDMMSRQPSGPWMSISQLRQMYDVDDLGTAFDVIPEDINLLVVIHPKELTDRTRYAIDQYVVGGGHALIFVDPNAESDQAGGGMMGGMMMGMGGDKSSSLPILFKAWGIEMDKSKVLADGTLALSVGSPSGRPVRHLGILGLNEQSFNSDDVITSMLNSVNVATSGAVIQLEDAPTDIEVLLHSTKNAMLMDASLFAMLFDPSSLYKDFKATGTEYPMAVRVTGMVKTAFPDGRPPEPEKAETGEDGLKAEEEEEEELAAEAKVNEDETKPVKELPAHIAESMQPVNVIVVADTDLLTDRLWVQKNNFFGQDIVQPFANNGDLLINMVDNLMGNADLISIRSRGQFSRPFDKVSELERQAEESFYQKEEELKQQLAETDAKLRQLQATKDGEDVLVLSPEQQAEVERFVQEKLKIRKQLRDVQHQLSKDIEKLGTQLKLINILAVPALITLIALGYRFARRRKRYS